MPRKLFVNLAVDDLDRSVQFFQKLGFAFDERFADETATCMLTGEDACARSFEDPDGHHWEVVWIDPAATGRGVGKRYVRALNGGHVLSVAPPPTAQQTELCADPLSRPRLLVVDDHPAVCAGLRGLLADEADFEVIAAVATAEAGIQIAEREPIDVAVVDYQLGGRNGLWLSRKLKRVREPPAVLIYSAYTDGVLAAAAVVAEADAIVSKGKVGSDLCQAIRSVAAGHRQLPALPPCLAESLRRRLDHEEQAIFGMLLAGLEPPEVAATLGLSAAGLESRLCELLRRLEGLPAAPAG